MPINSRGELPGPSGPWATRRILHMFHKVLLSSKDPTGTTIQTVFCSLNDDTPNLVHGDTECSRGSSGILLLYTISNVRAQLFPYLTHLQKGISEETFMK